MKSEELKDRQRLSLMNRIVEGTIEVLKELRDEGSVETFVVGRVKAMPLRLPCR